MTLWDELMKALRRDCRGPPPERTVPAEAPGASPDVLYLHRLLQQLPGQKGRGPEFYAAVDRVAQTQESTAVELLGRFAAALPEDDELHLRLAELLCGRREYQRAVPVLERILRVQRAPLQRVLRARDLLADAREAAGDEEGARRELEILLAEDLDHPRARGRLQRLQRAAGVPTAGALAAAGTPAGPSGTVPTLIGVEGVRHQRYRLLRELGRGSAGTVYLAHDTELDRQMAVKIFHPRHQEAGAAARAWNEARLTAAVRHPGVVAIYDLDDERNLVAMELCTGGTLRQRLQTGRLSVDVALRRAGELLDTLTVVHRTGVVHGDLKPGNLLFRGGQGANENGEEAEYGDLVVADFGIARLLGDEQRGDEGQAAGTLGYLAPERRTRAAALHPAADLYAAGAVLLEMLLGALPLSRWNLLRGAPLPATLAGPVAEELGPRRAGLEALLGRLLAEEPEARPDASAALVELRCI